MVAVVSVYPTLMVPNNRSVADLRRSVLLTVCVNLRKLLNLSRPQVSHL